MIITNNALIFCALSLIFATHCLSQQHWLGPMPQEFVSGTLYGIPYLGNYSGEQYEWRALFN